jgi:putative hemolysin
MTGITTEILLIAALIVINGILAMSEIAIVSARKTRLRQQAQAGDRGAAAALELAEQPTRFLSTVQIGITLVGILAGAFGGATIATAIARALESIAPLAAYAEAIALALVVGAITFLSLIIGELVPKRLALSAPERIATAVARPMRLLAKLARPLVALLSITTDALLRLMGFRSAEQAEITQEEVRILIAAGTEAGVFQNAERELVESTFQLSETHVRELMTPRALVDWIDLEDASDAQWRALASMPHLHVPLCRGELDNVVGVLAVRELVPHLIAGERPDLASLASPPLFLPEGLPAFSALEQFSHTGPHLALVLDEHGGVAGLLTPTDLLEALVGGLSDSTNAPHGAPVRRDDGSWLLDGLMPVEEATELFGIPATANADVQTLGGLVMASLGRIPMAGDKIRWHGVYLEVVDMDGRRVDKVLATVG